MREDINAQLRRERRDKTVEEKLWEEEEKQFRYLSQHSKHMFSIIETRIKIFIISISSSSSMLSGFRAGRHETGGERVRKENIVDQLEEEKLCLSQHSKHTLSVIDTWILNVVLTVKCNLLLKYLIQ